MALKRRVRSKRSKRFENVGDSKSEKFHCTFTDSESDDNTMANKVRNEFRITNLMKSGENFKVDDDHIYSCGKSIRCDVVGRKRKISEESDEKPGKQKSCSKNAVMARINRERKKKYIMSLETEKNELLKKNEDMQKKIDAQNETIGNMKQEILYLRGLVANSKELGQIIQNLKATTNLPITSSMINTSEKMVKNVSSTKECMTEITPKTKTVSCGINFPILDKDVNLSCSSDKSYSFGDLGDIESPGFSFENDCFDNFFYETSQESLCNFNLPSLNLELDNLPNEDEVCHNDFPPVGICLHVNKKRVSVEICSICNKKANFPDETLNKT